MQKELLIPRSAGDRRRRHADANQAGGGSLGSHPCDHGLVHRGIGHKSAGTDLAASRFELRLDQGHDVGVWCEERREGWEDVP